MFLLPERGHKGQVREFRIQSGQPRSHCPTTVRSQMANSVPWGLASFLTSPMLNFLLQCGSYYWTCIPVFKSIKKHWFLKFLKSKIIKCSISFCLVIRQARETLVTTLTICCHSNNNMLESLGKVKNHFQLIKGQVSCFLFLYHVQGKKSPS